MCSSWVFEGDKNENLYFFKFFFLLLSTFPSFYLLLIDFLLPVWRVKSLQYLLHSVPAMSVEHALGHPCQWLTPGSGRKPLVETF